IFQEQQNSFGTRFNVTPVDLNDSGTATKESTRDRNPAILSRGSQLGQLGEVIRTADSRLRYFEAEVLREGRCIDDIHVCAPRLLEEAFQDRAGNRRRVH